MVLRGIDLRTSFAISIGFLLGLLSLLNPGYFHAMLPPAIRPMMSDMLTVSLFTAIVLTLLFRIGIRERLRIVWRDSGKAFEDLKALLQSRAKDWKLDSDLIGRAADTVDNAVRHGREGEFIVEPGQRSTPPSTASSRGSTLSIGGQPHDLSPVPTPAARHRFRRNCPSPSASAITASATTPTTPAFRPTGDLVTIRFGFAV